MVFVKSKSINGHKLNTLAGRGAERSWVCRGAGGHLMFSVSVGSPGKCVNELCAIAFVLYLNIIKCDKYAHSKFNFDLSQLPEHAHAHTSAPLINNAHCMCVCVSCARARG